MKIEELIRTLEEKAFNEKEKDSGIHFSKVMDHIKLVCYIEPGVDVQFVTFYRWNNNDVKGTYTISVKNLMYSKDTVAELFKKTKEKLPQQIGLCIDTHVEVDGVIGEVFE